MTGSHGNADRILPYDHHKYHSDIRKLASTGAERASFPAFNPEEVSVRHLADALGVPVMKDGRYLRLGIGRDGKPWASYGVGPKREWIPRSDVYRAVEKLVYGE